MIFGFVDLKTLFTIVHLFGIAIGAGGAFMSDAMFFSSIKDEKISHTEMRFLKLGSRMVWLGLFILVCSGLLLFFLDPVKYLASSKFLAKITIVGIIILNGFFFHLFHLPRLARHEGTHFPSSDEFMRKSSLLLLSGVISVVSWSSALVLGAFRKIPYEYHIIIFAYGCVVAIGFCIALFLKKRIFPLHRKPLE